MVPGLSEVDCRVAEFRYRELRAEAARHRTGHVSVAPHERLVAAADLGALVGSLLVRARRRLHGARPGEAGAPVLAVSAELGAGK